MKSLASPILVAVYMLSTAHALNNGLALTPPMGWLSTERFRCNTDCLNDPENCISEKLFKTMADLLVSEGYKDKGYDHINVEDCWMSKKRDANGSLVPDPDRFPNGIKGLADYVHSKGLKLGIYLDFGTFTCVDSYPGSKFYLQQDAETIAAWGADMLKFDGCHSNIQDMEYGYPTMGFYLNRTGRPILYACSWPAYVVFSGHIPDYKRVAKTCNIWRNYRDIQDKWVDVKNIIDYYGNDAGNFSQVAGPGNFNDPDQLIIGDYSLSYDQERVQMAMWSIMAAPLLMSNDLRTIKPEAKQLLQNDRLISVNQDKNGVQGKRIMKMNKLEVWTKPIGRDAKEMAFAFLNFEDRGGPTHVSMPLSKLGLTAVQGYKVIEAFSGTYIGVLKPRDLFNASVNPSGVYMGIAYFDE